MKIRIDHIAKIEGHASFTADIVGGDIQSAQIKIEEGARLFEGIMRGRKDIEVPESANQVTVESQIDALFASEPEIEEDFQTKSPSPLRWAVTVIRGREVENQELDISRDAILSIRDSQ